jgi:hypothetical protein
MDWLYARCKVLPFWPTNSRDLNPIQFLGNDETLTETAANQRLKGVRDGAFEMWDRFELGMITSLVSSFPKKNPAVPECGPRIDPTMGFRSPVRGLWIITRLSETTSD